MTIKEINIHSFGKLKNKKIQLTDNFNVIYGTNESGKSTISAFIEAMLYSYPARDAERKKYIPWDEAHASGSLTLKNEGKDITIYRKITPVPSRDELEIVPPVSLKDFIPSDRETYRKSVYSGEGRATDFGRSSGIDARIANILTTGDESISADSAIKKLEGYRKILKPKKGSGGKKYELENKITLLENELHSARLEAENRRRYEEELSLAEKELDSLKERKNTLLSSLNSAADDFSASLDGEISVLSEHISALPDGEFSPPVMKISIRAILIYIICPIFLIIPAVTVSYWFFVLSVLVAIWGISHYMIARKKYQKALKSFLADYNCTKLSEYRQKIDERITSERELNSLLSRKRALSDEVYSKSMLQRRELDEVTRRMLAVSDNIILQKSRFSFASARPEGEIISELNHYKALRDETEKKIKAIDCAIEAILYAKDHLSETMTPSVTEKAMEYIEKIAPKEGRRVVLNEDLSLFLTDPMPQQISSCSFGLKEEIYLCFRIALSEYLYKNEFPLIFDDPFSGSDDYREKALIDLFSHISENRQVIIFTNRKNAHYNQIQCNFVDITPSDDV